MCLCVSCPDDDIAVIFEGLGVFDETIELT